VLYGIFALLLQLAALTLVAVVAMRPELLPDWWDTLKVSPPMGEFMDPSATAGSVSESRVWWLSRKNWTDDDKFVAMLLAGGSITATLMLIYGSLKGRPGHMVPFMGLQVFDFCITSLTVVSYFSYVPDVKRWMDEQNAFPLKNKIMSVEADWLMLAVVLAFVAILVIKAYLIGVVWSCYKYLGQQQQQLALTAVYPHDVTGHPEDCKILLPPKYEDIAQLPPNFYVTSPPPPPYTG
jgi:lysosomal-associated transmembrane protein